MKKIITTGILILMFGYIITLKMCNQGLVKNKIDKSMTFLNFNLDECDTSTINFEFKEDSLFNHKNNNSIRLTERERTIKKIELNLKRFLNGVSNYEDLKIIDPYLKLYPSILNDIPSMTPLTKNIYVTSSKFGIRTHPITKKIKAHNGYDFAADINSKVYATADGRVDLIRNSNTGYGNYIEIKHRFGFKTKYGHLNKILVLDNQIVKQGDLIGLVGSTGLSTGPHLHYEIVKNDKMIDPYMSFNIKYEYYKIAFQNSRKDTIK